MKILLSAVCLLILSIPVFAEAQSLRLTPPRSQFLNEQLQDKDKANGGGYVRKTLKDRSKMHHVTRPDPRKLNPGSGNRIQRKREETHTTVPVQPVYRGENH